MYDTMKVWEAVPPPGASAVEREFAAG